MDSVFESLAFVNSSGDRVILSDPSISKYWELRGRSGFTAPEVELITQEYANGTTKILKRKIVPRTVTVNMVVVGDTTAQRDKLFFDMVNKLIDPKGDGIGRLYVKCSDGAEVYLNCAYSSGMKIVEEYKKFHRFTIEFYAADPYFYKDLPDFVIHTAVENYLRVGPLVSMNVNPPHIVGEVTSIGSGTFHNYSDVVIQPVIKLSGAANRLYIRNVTNDDNLRLANMSINQDAVLVIDTRDGYKSIYTENQDGTKSPAGQFLDWGNLDFDFGLIPGDNEISYYGNPPSMITEVIFYVSERHLSA